MSEYRLKVSLWNGVQIVEDLNVELPLFSDDMTVKQMKQILGEAFQAAKNICTERTSHDPLSHQTWAENQEIQPR